MNLKHLLIKTFSCLIAQALIIILSYFILSHLVGFFHTEKFLTLPGFAVELSGTLILLLLFTTITNNLAYSFIISNLLYLIFTVISLVKISYLSFPVVYYDLFQVSDLLLNLESIDPLTLISVTIFLALVLIVVIIAAVKSSLSNYRLFSSLILVVCLLAVSQNTQRIKKFFNVNKIKYKWNSNIYIKSQENGLLTFFIQSLFFSNKLEKPLNYSLSQASAYISQASNNKSQLNNGAKITPDNVVVLMVESFQNAEDLPWKTNIEVTPFYNKLSQQGQTGYLISPSFGGKSINAEFELLTGFSNVFNPVGSIPYKDFIHHNIPSLAHEFKQNQFTTNAIQVVTMKGYGYGSIYEHLGFDNKFSLSRLDKNIKLDPTNRFGSSQEIASKISELIKKQDRSFIFAFPNSSHSPWKISHYPNNKIKLLNTDLESDFSNEIIAYYNSLTHVDQLFQSLVQQLDDNEHTVIFIVGDHQPALKANKLMSQNEWSFKDKINKHLVPYLVWSNYDLDIQVTHEPFTSMNFVSLKLLQIANIEPNGFYAFLENVFHEFKAFSFVLLKNGQALDVADEVDNETLKKYHFVQYKYLSDDG